MHRRELLKLLGRYREVYPQEGPRIDQFYRFVEEREDCLLRSCSPGHITASAWIVSADHGNLLLTRHRKLGRWLQLGGHVDGATAVDEAALREAREESGMERFELALCGGRVVPLDLDIHAIPARDNEPRHLHYDVRFLLIAAPGQTLRCSAESLDLRWFPSEELISVSDEEGLHRLQRKASVWLAQQ